MKVYNLSCQHNHRFEGWFSSEADFADQLEKRLLSCPVCDSLDVKRMPSAPRLNLSAVQQTSVDQVQQDFHKQWIEIARAVIENTEDVGERFAEEARRIHYKETSERGIRGVASPEEFNALAEEGIDVTCLPMPASLKQPLQ